MESTNNYAGDERRFLERAPIEAAYLPGRISIFEQIESKLTFNVMPNKPVTETLKIKEYKIRPRYIEGIFDRDYKSSMEASPSHLIFISAQVHAQKLAYTYLCHEFQLPYDPHGPELIKVWPTVVNSKMPEMITQEKDLCQKFWITKLVVKSDVRIFIDYVSKVNNGLVIEGKAMILKI